jgi:hypothetical protein
MTGQPVDSLEVSTDGGRGTSFRVPEEGLAYGALHAVAAAELPRAVRRALARSWALGPSDLKVALASGLIFKYPSQWFASSAVHVSR